MSGLKKLYSKIFPASKYQAKKIAEEIKKDNISIGENLLEIQKTNIEIQNKMSLLIEKEKKLELDLHIAEEKIKNIENKLYVTEKHAYHALLQSQEAVWAHVWHDTIQNTEWLDKVSFSPGRWAVGYQCLYVLYRILHSVQPKMILELGLGQSTRLIGAYAGHYTGVSHTVVEHDEEWISFFLKDSTVSENTHIEQLDLITDKFLDDDQVLMYKDFESRFKDKKYSLLCIDSPFGGKAKKYARVDALKIIPDCLSESFVIMVDDYNRAGEKEMVKKLEDSLNEAGIKFCKGIYSGEKQLAVIASEKWNFLCSL